MMITPATSDSLNAEHLAEYQLTGRLQRNVDPGVSGELLFRPTRQLTLDGWLARSNQDQEQDGRDR